MLRKNPIFTLVAVVTLALGIGANVAIFSVANAVLLKPLPYSRPDQLVQIWQTNPRANRWGDWVSYPDFVDWRGQNQVFEDVGAYRPWLWSISGGNQPEALMGARVTSNLFSVLSVHPVLGRSFLPEEDQPGQKYVVIFSYSLWQRRFGSDPNLIGKTVGIDGANYTVIGIMPPGFDLPANIFNPTYNFDIWMPTGADPEREDRGSYNYRAFARLKPGITIGQAQANMEAIARRLGEQYPNQQEMSAVVAEIQAYVVRETRTALLIFFGVVGFVLLIACANLINLQLALTMARQKEIAIRQALGASRSQLIRQLLTESLLLALLGGAIGLFLAEWYIKLIAKFGSDLPRLQDISIDPRVIGFAFILSLVTGVMFGLVPAFQGSRIDINGMLKEFGARSATGGGMQRRTRSLLVITEMALALMLLICAGLLIQSFVRLQNVDPGFNPRRVVAAYLILPSAKYPEPSRQAAFFKEVLERIEALPAVEAAGASSAIPLTGINDSGFFQVEGQSAQQSGETLLNAEQPKISPDYFRVMGIPISKGRAFTWADNESSPEVAIISETLARHYWPSEDPLGKRVSINNQNGQPVWRQVVGVVKDVKHDGLADQVRPAIYVPLFQFPVPYMFLAVRTQTEFTGLAAAIQKAVMDKDIEQPVFKVNTMERFIYDSVSRSRLQTILLMVFAAIALTLAVVGIYGVMTYTVNQRTHEIGIRMALGAGKQDVLKMVVMEGLKLVSIGVTIGLIGAFAVTRLMKNLLFEVSTTEPTIFSSVAFLLIIVALSACYIPARRAVRVDPISALRYR